MLLLAKVNGTATSPSRRPRPNELAKAWLRGQPVDEFGVGPRSIGPEHREHHFACSFFSPAIVIGQFMNAEECYNGMEQQLIYPEAICLNP